MVRLPAPGQDDGSWGHILNEFLLVEHTSDGTLKTSGSLGEKANDADTVHIAGNETIGGVKTFAASPIFPLPTIPAQAATKQYVDDSIAATGTPDATTSSKGTVQLAGDLTGTATAPVIAANVIANGHISSSAAIAQSKIANLTTDLTGKINKSTIISKGDILVGSAPATPGRLASGINGQMLMTDYSQDSGLRWEYQEAVLLLPVGDETTALTTGLGKATYHAPMGMNLVAIPRASLVTASSSGNVVIDIKAGGTSLLGVTKLTIDAGQKTSITSGSSTSIATAIIADDAELTIDIISSGSNAAGLKLTLYYRRSFSFSAAPPSGYLQYIGGTTYEVNSPLIHVSELPFGAFASLPMNFYLRYRLRIGVGDIVVTAACRKDEFHSMIAQSCFTMLGQLLTATVTTAGYSFGSVDDHDTLFMDGSKKGYIDVTANSSTLGSATLQDFTISSDNTITAGTTLVRPQGYSEQFWTNATVIAFPAVNKTLYLRHNQLYVNGFSPVNTAAGFATYVGNSTSWANRIITVSDGINSFVTFVSGAGTTYWYTEIDMTNGTIRRQQQMSAANGFSFSNSTEEDAIGDQLFSVDGSLAFYRNLVWYYGGDSYLENFSTNFKNSTAIGSINTQTGMDIITAITPDNFAVFADWGHDNGGLFNFGSDSQLGWAKTNIRFLGDNPVL